MRLSQTSYMALVGLLTTTSYAQETAATIEFWADENCGQDLMGDDTRSSTFTVYEENVITEEDKGACTVTHKTLGESDNPWPKANDRDYKIYIDKTTLGDDCVLWLFDPERQDDEESNDCKSSYATVKPGRGCKEAGINGKFGYGYCCGKGCQMPKTKDLIDQGSKRSIDRESHISQADKRRARKAIEHKREPPFGLTRKRDDCKFEAESEKPRSTYGDQYRVTQVNGCSSGDGCSVQVEFSYSQMESESFSAGASVGGELFKAIGVEVNFEGEWSESEEQGLSMSTTFNTPQNSGGWVTFEPKLQCAKGKFTGDCDDWDSDKEGEACFVETVSGGAPDGYLSFVTEI